MVLVLFPRRRARSGARELVSRLHWTVAQARTGDRGAAGGRGEMITATITYFADTKAQTARRATVDWEELCDKLAHPKATHPTKTACPLFVGATFGDTRSQDGALRHA